MRSAVPPTPVQKLDVSVISHGQLLPASLRAQACGTLQHQEFHIPVQSGLDSASIATNKPRALILKEL
jgi:hypothetical protein